MNERKDFPPAISSDKFRYSVFMKPVKGQNSLAKVKRTPMRRIFRFLLPLLILLASIGFAASLISNAPKTERQRPKATKPVVEVLVLHPQKYQIKIPSRGTVTPRTETILTSEVSGRVVQVSDNFHPGGFFEAGDILLQIDPRDYHIAVTVARSEITLKQFALAQEQARSKQAKTDWDKMNFDEPPDPLLLRTPQLEHANADLEAAHARLQQAKLDLERTTITAPYAGRIKQKSADIGQYLTTGKELAQIYASDAVEVRLPLTNEQLRYLQLPEEFRHNGAAGQQPQAAVNFTLERGDQSFHWTGQLIRTEGTIDVESRQLFAIAKINDPYLRKANRPQLKIGQFVSASITGEQLADVYVIPRGAVHDMNTVHIIDQDNTLIRRDLNILWRDDHQVIASGPLKPGERISLTRLSFAAEGISVQPADDHTGKKKAGKNRNGQKL
jgi:RND family efflux transporter MFP subunit